VYNRETMLAMLFRETDRVQRLNSSLSLLLLDVDDFGHWNSRLGNGACDDLLLPGGDQDHAPAAQLRHSRPARQGRVPARPARLQCRERRDAGGADSRGGVCNSLSGGRQFHSALSVLWHCLQHGAVTGGGASRGGTSPAMARTAGPESIQCFGDCPNPYDGPVRYLSSSSGDELMAW